MKRILVISFIFFLVWTSCHFSKSWSAKWIWSSLDGPDNTWMCFRKTFNLSSVPASALANIAVDSKYWLWINGSLVVFEGGLKRGPTPSDTYYDEVNIKPFLKTGANTIAVLVWFWGKDGFSHNNSGKGGFLFQAKLGDSTIKSDSTWKMLSHPAYKSAATNLRPNLRLSEHNVHFDAQDDSVTGWIEEGYDDSWWSIPADKGTPPVGPWNNLWKRPIPQWKNFGLKNYSNLSVSLPYTTSSTTTIIAYLPYNAHITPYLEVEASAGKTIDIQTDNYHLGSREYSVRAEYITKKGNQTFESFGWMNGHDVRYTIPSGVTVKALKYRETGYDTDFIGSFSCSDKFYNILWEKARRTLYVCMRDNFFDCPDRERAQWWGDVVNQISGIFYIFDSEAHKLIAKAISNLVQWRKSNGILYSPVPSGNFKEELPSQILASVGEYGFWHYYYNTGDTALINEAYTHVADYLALWSIGSNGLINYREGDWNWGDWGSNIDKYTIQTCMYYMALKTAKKMAQLTANTKDIPTYESKISSIESNFDSILWQGSYYKSGDVPYPDDRANALAVVAGLADPARWPDITNVFKKCSYASPYMEKYVLEALCIMGEEEYALIRMKSRYIDMVNASVTTLYENFPTRGTYNHSWNAPHTILSKYIAGVAPESVAWATYHVLPQEGNLTSVNVRIPSIKGKIEVDISKSQNEYSISLTSPADTTAVVGIPKKPFSQVKEVWANDKKVYEKGTYLGGVSGISWNGEDGSYIKYNANPGIWRFVAYGTSATGNLALHKKVNTRSTIENNHWGKERLNDGIKTSVDGNKGFSSEHHSGPYNNEWVEIDLGSNRAFDQVKLFPRTDSSAFSGGTANFPKDFTIQVKPKGGSYSTVIKETDLPNPNGKAVTYSLGRQKARYLKVNAIELGEPAYGEPDNYRLQFAEIEIYNKGGRLTPTPILTSVSNVRLIAKNHSESTVLHCTEKYHSSRGTHNVVTTPKSGNSNAKEWIKEDIDGNYFRLISKINPAVCLQCTQDHYMGDTGVFWVCASLTSLNSESQKWKEKSAGNGYIRLVNKAYPDYVLHCTNEIHEYSNSAYNVVVSPKSWNHDHQKWKWEVEK